MAASGSDGGCEHYRRRCLLVAPCCGRAYPCRLCHDECKHRCPYDMNRFNVALVQCLDCETVQRVGRRCMSCGVTFGNAYFCVVCRLYDDDDDGQYHCAGCGLCRKGGRKNFFHCNTCGLCLPKSLKGNHKCCRNGSHHNCRVCGKDLHSSTIPCVVPPCGHLIHKTCYDQRVEAGRMYCVLCGASVTR